MNQSNRFWRIGIVLASLAGPVAVRADLFTVQINDVTESVSATINGQPVTPLPDSTGEFLHFHVALTSVLTFTSSASTDLLEPVTGAFSDRLFGSNTQGDSFLNVIFGSDPATAPISTNYVFPPLTETGQQQFVFEFFDGTDTVTFSAASDVDAPVPEPSAIILLSTVIGLVGFKLRRPSRAASE